MKVDDVDEVETYLIAHLGTRVYVETQIVVGEFGRLLLQLPGESDLPAERTRAEIIFYRHMVYATKQTHVFRLV